jgi:ribosomal protein S18 acetylase RimI-like enzyme
MNAQKDPATTVVLVRAGDLSKLGALLRAIEREENPDDPHAVQRSDDGLLRSLKGYAVTQSVSTFILLAFVQEEPVGMATLVRIPKLDDRIGLLYLDELHVLKAHRRCGVGSAIITKAVELTRELGLAGIRLLTRPANVGAQRFYEHLGFTKHPSFLYEQIIDRQRNPLLE